MNEGLELRIVIGVLALAFALAAAWGTVGWQRVAREGEEVAHLRATVAALAGQLQAAGPVLRAWRVLQAFKALMAGEQKAGGDG